MNTTDKSLRGLFSVPSNYLSSILSSHVDIPIGPDTPVIPPVISPIVTPTTPTYTSLNFGENAINNHYSADAGHSEKVQAIFNYVTRDYRDRCTSYQTYNDSNFTGNIIRPDTLLAEASKVKADIIFTPYVNAAVWENADYNDFVLSVGSHYDNDGQGDNQVGTDNNRHDITSGPNIFLANSVAVSSRRDTPDLFKNSTSEGYGMEFFEDCSREALDADYPSKDIPVCFWECDTNIDGSILHNFRGTVDSQIIDSSFEVGMSIWVVRADGTKEYTTIVSFIDSNHFNISPSITPIVGTSLYAWHNDTLGGYIYGQAESWATPMVAGKLKVIKMVTNKDWNTVRMAARATAKRNPTGIPEIDNINWDIYRGFGQIQIQDAINYINNSN